jgi:hypothetical protein
MGFACVLNDQVQPAPEASTVRKHVEALEKFVEWRIQRAPDLVSMAANRQMYGVMMEVLRADTKAVRKAERKHTQKNNLVSERAKRGKHVDAKQLFAALRNTIKTWWKPAIQMIQEEQVTVNDVFECGTAKGARRMWNRMLGTLFVAFYCYHPNRPQALVQITMGSFDAFVTSATPIPFSGVRAMHGCVYLNARMCDATGKTEESAGPQTLVLEDKMKRLCVEYRDHFRPMSGASEDKDAPLFVTVKGSKLPSGGPAFAMREFCSFETAILGDGAAITPTDAFKIMAHYIKQTDPRAIDDIVQARGTSLLTFERNYQVRHGP